MGLSGQRARPLLFGTISDDMASTSSLLNPSSSNGYVASSACDDCCLLLLTGVDTPGWDIDDGSEGVDDVLADIVLGSNRVVCVREMEVCELKTLIKRWSKERRPFSFTRQTKLTSSNCMWTVERRVRSLVG
ncbi:hypothetical protein LIER_06847 [Lithospermum erythrorhizon]|uniref:Uncharacterized protein n=1 Tax=Lithospermum erythrorhizon TaxID=34254 RepID=A0AAV3P6B3_LITER